MAQCDTCNKIINRNGGHLVSGIEAKTIMRKHYEELAKDLYSGDPVGAKQYVDMCLTMAGNSGNNLLCEECYAKLKQATKQDAKNISEKEQSISTEYPITQTNKTTSRSEIKPKTTTTNIIVPLMAIILLMIGINGITFSFIMLINGIDYETIILLIICLLPCILFITLSIILLRRLAKG